MLLTLMVVKATCSEWGLSVIESDPWNIKES